MTQPKEQNNYPATDTKEVELYQLSVKELKIIIFKKYMDFQVNRNKQLNELRK